LRYGFLTNCVRTITATCTIYTISAIFFHNNYSNNSWSSSVVVVGDICSCNDVDQGVKRGHPKRCDVYVECRARDYPAGVLCPVDECRNSIDGTCSSNCSDAVCKEAVPQSKSYESM
jgi:hypothetical protein